MSNSATPVPASTARKATRRRVHAVDQLAETTITVGGLFVIFAVLGICVYLAGSVVPLFQPGGMTPVQERPTATTALESDPAFIAVDEYRASILIGRKDGSLALVHLADGKVLHTASPTTLKVTAIAREARTGLTAFGLEDGSVQLGTISFTAEIKTRDEVPQDYRDMTIDTTSPGPVGPSGWPTVVQRVATDQFRVIQPAVEFRDPVQVKEGTGAIRLIDYRSRADSQFLVLARENGTIAYEVVRTTIPLGGGAPRVRLQSYPVPFDAPGRSLPDHLFVTGDGSNVLTVWNDGFMQRYGSRNPAVSPIQKRDQIDAITPGGRVTAAQMLLGGQTVLLGDDKGRVTCIFPASDPGSPSPDGERLVVAHVLPFSDSPITAIGISLRDRSIVIGDVAGRVGVRHVTSEKVVVPPTPAFNTRVVAALLTPKLDAVVAISSDGLYRSWNVDLGHADASMASLFGKVLYEGNAKPTYTYQSTSGEDAAETKFSLVPLIVGTLKATFFAMIFAAPLGVLAAIYTAEFMDRKLRAIIKPGIELMASLPSVVLGFVAAIVVAPFMRDWLTTILLGLGLVPLTMVLGAHLWQLMPPYVTAKINAWVKLGAILAAIAAGVGVSSLFAPIAERAMFTPTRSDLLVFGGSYAAVDASERPSWVGARPTMNPDDERKLRRDGLYFRDATVVRPVEPTADRVDDVLAKAHGLDVTRPSLTRWLDGNYGTPFPGWVFVLLPPAGILVLVVNSWLLKRSWEDFLKRFPWTIAAAFELAKFAVMVVASIGVAAAAAAALTAIGLDARDSVLGPYTQRNTLVVGLIMGFAIIPLIYTLSEDAMAAVPDSLRSASIGAGATPWQTAVRVVLPVAASGIFSACMIGLGRAVGETMIVVMATGNTPTMNWNLFEGFRTLSANIAVELPEAVEGSTHYRVLFLCALVLFVLTFAVNTSAEVVRQVYRKRSSAL